MVRPALIAILCSLVPLPLLADDPVEPPAGRARRLELSLREGETSLALELDAFELPHRGGRRVVLVPDREVPGLPLLSIVLDSAREPRPELADPHERRVADAILAWFEAESVLPVEWRAAGSEGSERIRLPSLRIDSRIEVARSCVREGESPAVLSVSLVRPVTESSGGGLQVELRTLEWRFELDEGGEFRSGELRREVDRAIGDVRQLESPVITIRVLSGADLTRADVDRIAAEHDLCAPAARSLLPGGSAEGVAHARELLARHRAQYPTGRLAPLVARLDARLATLGEELAAGSVDERAEKLVGKEAPDFALTDLEGQELTLSSLRGNPVVLSFWGYT